MIEDGISGMKLLTNKSHLSKDTFAILLVKEEINRTYGDVRYVQELYVTKDYSSWAKAIEYLEGLVYKSFTFYTAFQVGAVPTIKTKLAVDINLA